MARESQAEAGALFGFTAIGKLLELLEKPRDFSLGNADSVVLHFHLEERLVLLRYAQRNGAILRGELYGIREIVIEHLLEARSVYLRYQVRRHVDGKPEVLLFGQ